MTETNNSNRQTPITGEGSSSIGDDTPIDLNLDVAEEHTRVAEEDFQENGQTPSSSEDSHLEARPIPFLNIDEEVKATTAEITDTSIYVNLFKGLISFVDKREKNRLALDAVVEIVKNAVPREILFIVDRILAFAIQIDRLTTQVKDDEATIQDMDRQIIALTQALNEKPSFAPISLESISERVHVIVDQLNTIKRDESLTDPQLAQLCEYSRAMAVFLLKHELIIPDKSREKYSGMASNFFRVLDKFNTASIINEDRKLVRQRNGIGYLIKRSSATQDLPIFYNADMDLNPAPEIIQAGINDWEDVARKYPNFFRPPITCAAELRGNIEDTGYAPKQQKQIIADFREIIEPFRSQEMDFLRVLALSDGMTFTLAAAVVSKLYSGRVLKTLGVFNPVAKSTMLSIDLNNKNLDIVKGVIAAAHEGWVGATLAGQASLSVDPSETGDKKNRFNFLNRRR